MIATPPPAIPWDASTVRNVQAWVAIVPFDTQADFWPLITHSSPSSRAVHSNADFGSRNWSVPMSRESEACWGSVIAQQPMYLPSRSLLNGMTNSLIRSGLPLIAANENGNDVTPMEMAKSALPQPISSAWMCRASGGRFGPPNCSGRLDEW